MLNDIIETEFGPLSLAVISERVITIRTLGNSNINDQRAAFGPFWGTTYTVSADLFRHADGNFRIGKAERQSQEWQSDSLRDSLRMHRLEAAYRSASASVKTRVAKVIESAVAAWLVQHPDALRDGEMAALDSSIDRLDSDIGQLRQQIADKIIQREALIERKATLLRVAAGAAA